MLNLSSTSDVIRVITGAASDIEVGADWADVTGTPQVVTPGRTVTPSITTATTTTVVASPAAATVRNGKALYISNNHASTACDVTVERFDGTNAHRIRKVTLNAGESLDFVEGVGFRVFDAAGLEKMPSQIIPGDFTVKTLAALVTNSTTTAAKVAGLDTVCGSGTWIFEYFLRFQSATSTVGPKLSVNHTGTVTFFDYIVQFLTAAATDSSGVMDQDATAPVVMGGMAARAKGATAALIGTAGVDTINLDVLILVTGIAICTVSGNLELYHASETATATRIEAGSALRLTKVG